MKQFLKFLLITVMMVCVMKSAIGQNIVNQDAVNGWDDPFVMGDDFDGVDWIIIDDIDIDVDVIIEEGTIVQVSDDVLNPEASIQVDFLDGTTLTIEPGVNIQLEADADIRIYGTGVIGELADDPVSIVAINPAGDPWGEILFDNADNANIVHNVTFNHGYDALKINSVDGVGDDVSVANVVISDMAHAGIKIDDSDASVNGALISACTWVGLWVDDDPAIVTINDVEITDCALTSQGAFYLSDASPVITECRVYENDDAGILLEGVSMPDLVAGGGDANSIYSNAAGDAELEFRDASAPEVDGNNIFDPGADGFDGHVIINRTDQLDLDLQNNWWGDGIDLAVIFLDVDEYEDAFYDDNDDADDNNRGDWNVDMDVFDPVPEANGPLAGAAVDGIRSGHYLSSLWNSGDYHAVLENSRKILSKTESVDKDVIYAGHYMYRVALKIGIDMGQLRDNYLESYNLFSKRSYYMAFGLYAAKCEIESERFAEAVAILTSLRKEALERGIPRYAKMAEIRETECHLAMTDPQNEDECTRLENKVELLFAELQSMDDRPQVTLSTTTPETFGLLAAYPNPFNATTRLSFDLATAGHIELGIYDVDGKLIESLISGVSEAGSHAISWSAPEIPAGIYLVRLKTSDQIRTSKIVLVK